MAKLPQSWRDLTSAELEQLLDLREPLFSVADLIFAQWMAACRRTDIARKAEIEAEDAYFDAWELSIKNRTGKTLLASEAAERRRDRYRVRARRAEREQERLYAAYRAAAEDA
ncbi:hypothetical protein [Bosea minatitlanensis]|uniref:Uncharacterized protein n=1 Tax=Bosea minatitlanensis TaxID=128782 RepID=A0ABW0EYG9_9HYPH|nr:hypothetical protein [Bosea minatitlanensis]MCT4491783.1 hypothetical protein [Bosea minatitlanensis]